MAPYPWASWWTRWWDNPRSSPTSRVLRPSFLTSAGASNLAASSASSRMDDACHTRWGWDRQVEPGSFSSDVPRSADSLARLERLVAEHPGVEVRLGHQR